MTVVRTRRSPACMLPAVVCGAAILVSCGGSSSSHPGTSVVTLSATSGDFASYLVRIDGISLTPTNGPLVALPWEVAETVDLAALTDLSELLQAPPEAAGTYKSATLSLDYTGASIWVNLNGQAVLANAVDTNGNKFTSPTTVTITFDPNNPLTITAGKSSHLAIDIDLTASNSIDTSGSTPTVTVQPFLVITPAPADTTLMRVRGFLVTVETPSSDYVINTRPFSGPVTLPGHGAVTVSTDAHTYFNVGGIAYTGAAGLAAMASLAENTPIAAYGTLGDLSGITPGFHAQAVYAATSLESPLADHVTGVVSARSGNTLTVHGARLVTRLDNVTFYNNAMVSIDSGTVVTEDGVAASGLTSASISVGQQVDVSGQASVDSSGNLSMDATSTPSVSGAPPGQVRLTSTRIWGTLNSATPASASLNVLTLGNFATAAFNFAGTGNPVANPAAYMVNTGTLNESAVAAGTLLRVDGSVDPFGAAPPDFTATAITQGNATEQRLVVEWVNGGATAPFTSANTSGLVVDLANANLGSIHHILTVPGTLDLTRPGTQDLKSLPASPSITTVGADQSNLRLAIGSTKLSTGISVFNSVSGFASALSSTFNGTNKIYRLVAVGQFNGAANTFVASRISVALHE